MKQSFILSIALALVSLSDATEFISPSQPPVMSPIQSPVMSPTSEPSNSDCSSVIYSMVDCLSFLTIGSTDPTPTKTCCVGVKSVLEFNPQCLCSGLESSRAMGFVLDDKKALAIPKTCNVPIDPHCDVSTPAAQPALTPQPPMTSPSSAKSPAITPSLPTVTPSPPVVTSSPPTFTNSPPAVTASSPTMPVSSSTRTVSSPKVTASSPAPSPSISRTENLSLSKLFLAVTIAFSFSYMLA
ncbi:Non-specific lipid transfer protein GPI-anchored 23 [Cardamine amara subsp. amara]|uniref:Non-specific lipid transfer protein GPI-anchored 23 n=1 Tax=Cardamine amara subsp. amara TaxID=228776 RepID=A0ABD1BR15_CARAN